MENNSPLILTIDFGTQSVRTSLINKQGEIECLVKRKYDPPYVSEEKGSIFRKDAHVFDDVELAKEIARKVGGKVLSHYE